MDTQLDEVELDKVKKSVIDEYNQSITELRRDTEMYARKIEYFQQHIYEIEKNKQMYCKRTGGHTWKTEREQGLYGELFTYCEICKLGN
jgi:hypothetical protein